MDPSLNPRFDWAYRLANGLHVRTREGVIRRELTFREGDCYDPEALRESERVLRASAFLAEAEISPVERADGTVDVVVSTRDEWSTRVEPQLESGGTLALSGIELRENNLLGTGTRVSAFYLDSRELGETRVYGFGVATPQLFGTRLDAEVSAGRTPVGNYLTQSLLYPFVGERGRWAFLQEYENHDRFFHYITPLESPDAADRQARILLPERRRSYDLGAVYRIGGRERMTLIGAGIAGERIRYLGTPRFARPEEVRATDTALVGFVAARMDSVSSFRALLLLGQRNVFFRRRRALDAVWGQEDVRMGVEAEFAIGRTVGTFSTADDVSLDFGLFAAGDLPGGVLTGGRLVVEGKRNYDAPIGASEWDDVLAQADAWAYWRPSPESRSTLVASVAAAGGWSTTIPFQLTLGGSAGLRGFPRHRFPGGQRVVGSLEARRYLGWPYPNLFDTGAVAFVDAGQMWAGDAPFGVDSPLHASAGVGLRTAFPPGSRRTYRLDIGVPLTGDLAFRNVTVSVGVGQAIGFGAVRRDPQIRRSSRRSLSPSLFTFPN